MTQPDPQLMAKMHQLMRELEAIRSGFGGEARIAFLIDVAGQGVPEDWMLVGQLECAEVVAIAKHFEDREADAVTLATTAGTA